MSGESAANTPFEEADSLTDVVDLRARLAASIEVINGLDEFWPRMKGTQVCRYCGGETPHHLSDCKAKRILGA